MALSSQSVGLFLLWNAGMFVLVLLFSNRNYHLLTFPKSFCLLGVLGVAALVGTASQPWSPETLPIVAVILLIASSFRWISDLLALGRYRTVKAVCDELAADIHRCVPGIDSISARQDCRLDVLTADHVAKRISQGCRNVEAAGVFVTRNFARFMRLATVNYEHFTAAMLRYLTVRRYVTESGGSGTHRGLQSPVVPAWNEVLFPVRPPHGFVNWLDPLFLSNEWDRVSICGTCGGSGIVRCSTCSGSGRVSQSYTEYVNGRSETRTRQVSCSSCGGSGRKTCGTCNGCGRLQFSRTLNTQWQRLFPTITSPAVPMPELLEGAEERVYLRTAYVEDRNSLPFSAEDDGIQTDLRAELEQAGLTLANLHQAHAARVAQLHDGIVYRADFQVVGFGPYELALPDFAGKWVGSLDHGLSFIFRICRSRSRCLPPF